MMMEKKEEGTGVLLWFFMIEDITNELYVQKQVCRFPSKISGSARPTLLPRFIQHASFELRVVDGQSRPSFLFASKKLLVLTVM